MRKAKDIVQFLVDNGADINAKEDLCDRTPLHMSNSPIITKILIDRDANTNAETTNGDFQHRFLLV